MHKLVWLSVIFIGLSGPVLAQHVHLTQLYATPLNLNPAFAGAQAEAGASVKYRTQWPKLQNSYKTIQASGDYRFKDTNNGIGLLLYQDDVSNGGMSRTEAAGSYAYHADLTDKWSLSGGIGAGVGMRKANFDKLIFGDQISDNGYLVSSTQEAQADFNRKAYFSLNAGVLVADKNFWISAAGYHLNRPAQSVTDNKDPLQASYIISSGYKFFLNETFAHNEYEETSISPVVLYHRQGGIEQFNFGLYATYLPLQGGLIMKGISLLGETRYSQALALLLGVSIGHFNAGYSYDIPLTGIGRSAGGAHELSVIFQQINYNKIYRKRVRYKKYRHVPCPLF